MNHALIMNGRVVDVSAYLFPVSDPLYWVECPDEATTDWKFENGVISAPAQPSLADLKELKNIEINQSRLAANLTTFTHSGKVFACDQLSRGDIDGINGYVGTRGGLPGNWVGGWKSVDNSIYPIPDVATWNAFYDSMIAQGQANFLKSQNLKMQLESAIDAEQVAAIKW